MAIQIQSAPNPFDKGREYLNKLYDRGKARVERDHQQQTLLENTLAMHAIQQAQQKEQGRQERSSIRAKGKEERKTITLKAQLEEQASTQRASRNAAHVANIHRRSLPGTPIAIKGEGGFGASYQRKLNTRKTNFKVGATQIPFSSPSQEPTSMPTQPAKAKRTRKATSTTTKPKKPQAAAEYPLV